jgi:uncharacterized protein (DUF111 family)
MKILCYDCFSGISGDMNLGAMIGLGIEKESETWDKRDQSYCKTDYSPAPTQESQRRRKNY